jgi:hypothetical protein
VKRLEYYASGVSSQLAEMLALFVVVVLITFLALLFALRQPLFPVWGALLLFASGWWCGAVCLPSSWREGKVDPSLRKLEELEEKKKRTRNKFLELRKYRLFCLELAESFAEDSIDSIELKAFAAAAKLQEEELGRQLLFVERELRVLRFKQVTS